MKEVTTSLDFNSAISGIREDGKWRDNDHDATVKPVRGLVMSRTDGITGMRIGRFGAQVQHFAEIISANDVLQAFQGAIDELVAQQTSGQPTEITTLFPLRGEKVPTVTIDPTSASRRTPHKVVAARLNSDITVYSKDGKKWDEFVAMVGEALANIDGARGYEIYLNEVQLVIDTRVCSVAQAQTHMDKVIQDLYEEKVILPYTKDPVITFRSFDTN